MTLLGTRVGRLDTDRSPSETICWRCGYVFNRTAENVIPGAPCQSCRTVLRAEGDTTVWDSRKQKATAA